MSVRPLSHTQQRKPEADQGPALIVRIRIGSTEFHLVKPCARCVLTTVDQVEGVKTGKEPLATLSGYRNFDGKVLFGQNLIAESVGGTVSVGDEVTVLK